MRFYQSSGGEHGPPRNVRRSVAAVLVAFVLLVGVSTVAKANTIELSLSTVSFDAGSGFWAWTYSASVTGATVASSEVIAGDYFAILDFGGQTAATIAKTMAGPNPAGWTYATGGHINPLFTPVPFNSGTQTGWSLLGGLINGFDSAAIANAQWTYDGTAGTFVNDSLLGSFTVWSTIGRPPPGPLHVYGGDDTEVATGNPKSNFATVSAPGAFGPTPVPLPAAGFAGMALFGLIGGKRLRQARQA
jgi:hypothetical protein